MRKSLDTYEKLLPVFPQQKGIPKVIYQTYRSKTLPKDIADSIETLRWRNPGWEYRLYDDADIEQFITEHYGGTILSYYHSISPQYGAVKADLFRYLLIYKHGGVYLDLKSTINMPLDEVLLPDDCYILSHWDNEKGASQEGWGGHTALRHLPRGEFQQWHIIASAGHPFLRAVLLQVLQNIDNYNPFVNGIGKLGALKTTGPIAYTLAIQEVLSRGKHRLVHGIREIGLQYTIYEQSPEHDLHIKILKSSYSRTHAPVIQTDSFFVKWAAPYFYCVKNVVRYKNALKMFYVKNIRKGLGN